jgi:uncharacterized protein (TIGR02145 family)
MKSICKITPIFIAGALIIFTQSCKQEQAVLTTAPVTAITATTAKSGGEIKFEGEPKFKIYGICWSTSENPTIANTRTGNKTGSNEFISTVTGLTPNTTYYVRAYATNSAGTAYGEQVKFTTITSVPVLVTSSVTDITSSSATCGNIIISNGGSAIQRVGVCWDTVPGPTIAGSKTIDSLQKSVFLSHPSGLKFNKTYYIRAYAINSVGTAYGEEKTIRTNILTEIKKPEKPIPKGQKPVSPPPSRAVSNVKDQVNTSPKVRAVANIPPDPRNLKDSLSALNLTDIDGNAYNFVSIGSQDWMKENLKVTRYNDGTPIPNVTDNKAWSSLTTGGYCWYSNDQTNSNSALGALYNWYAVTDPHKLCPDGWRVATDADWKNLEIFLGMTPNQADGTVKRAPGKASDIKNTTGWIKQGKGTNSTAFSALAAGFRLASNGQFSNLGLDGCWWTATEDKAGLAWLRNMYYYLTDIYRISDKKNSGFSVRCIKEK